MRRNIKIRLFKLGKTQRWLLKEVRKRGFSTLHEPKFSTIVNGYYTSGYAGRILDLCDIILKKEENGGQAYE